MQLFRLVTKYWPPRGKFVNQRPSHWAPRVIIGNCFDPSVPLRDIKFSEILNLPRSPNFSWGSRCPNCLHWNISQKVQRNLAKGALFSYVWHALLKKRGHYVTSSVCLSIRPSAFPPTFLSQLAHIKWRIVTKLEYQERI